MKKSEREALKNAFNIPEPQNKDSFAANYESLYKKNQRRLRFPVYTKYVSTAVFAALVIGVWGHMTVSRDYIDKYRNGNITQETTVATTTVDPQPSTESGGEDKLPVVTEISVQTAEMNITVSTQTVTTVFSNSETFENTENNSEEEIKEENNEEEPKVTSAQTVNVNRETTSVNVVTAVTVTSKPNIRTTASVNTPPTTTTYNSIIHVPVTTACEDEPVLDVTEPANCPAPIVPQTTRTNNDASKPIETTAEQSFSPSPSDVTESTSWINPTVKYEKTDSYINIKELSNEAGIPGLHPNVDDTDVNASWNVGKLFERSKYIISAQVIQTIYTSVDNKPYTQYDLVTNCCYKREGKYPLMPSVYVPGGYIPADVYCEWENIENSFSDDTMIYYDGGNRSEIESYQPYIFFINDGFYDMPDGSYRLTAATDISIFAYDGEKYVSLGNPNLTFTEQDLSYLT